MKTFGSIIFVLALIFICTSHVFATDNPPDPPQADHGGNTDLPPGGGAPIGGGTFILMGFVSVYGAYKLRRVKRNIAALIFCIFLFLPALSFATDTPPNPPAGNHGADGDISPGGGAPIGGGTFILIGLVAAYAAKKVYSNRKIDLEE